MFLVLFKKKLKLLRVRSSSHARFYNQHVLVVALGVFREVIAASNNNSVIYNHYFIVYEIIVVILAVSMRPSCNESLIFSGKPE